MIIVTGGSGNLGSAIVRALVGRVAASGIGVSVRDPDKASELAALGVRVRQGTFEDGASLAHAFEGATQVLLVSSNARAHGGDSLAQHRTAIEAARAAGARRVVYTSHQAASAGSAFPPMHDHAATEAVLASSGIAWTSLRNGFYAASSRFMIGDAATTGVLDVPQAGKVSWTTHADLAEAAAATLADEGRFDGPTPPLTAQDAVSLDDVARAACEAAGKTFRRLAVDDETHRALLLARGVPPRVVDISMGFYLAARNGEFEATSPVLAELIGRAPQRVTDLVAGKLG